MKNLIFLFAIALFFTTGCGNDQIIVVGKCTVVTKVPKYGHIGNFVMKTSAGDTIVVKGVRDNIFLNTKVGDLLEIKENTKKGFYFATNPRKIGWNSIGNCEVVKKYGTKDQPAGARMFKVRTLGGDTLFVSKPPANIFFNVAIGDSVKIKIGRVDGGYSIGYMIDEN